MLFMMRILGKRQSINVRKVLWACDEIGVAYAQEDWGIGARETAAPEFLALNPKALVPVLIDGDIVLTESNTIVRYLAAKHRRSDLLPENPRERARVEEIMDWQATDFNFAWRTAFQALVRQNPLAGNNMQIERSLKEWAAMVGLLEARLSRIGPYVCGSTFTVADIVIGLSVNRWYQSPIERQIFPAVQSYFDRIKNRKPARPYIQGETD
jgi:glutathione S-transferase